MATRRHRITQQNATAWSNDHQRIEGLTRMKAVASSSVSLEKDMRAGGIYRRPRLSSLSNGALAAEAMVRRPGRVAVIAIANHKGGVGKSFTAVSLAAGLSSGGWRTLLVDCDAQGNSTSMFDPDDDVEFDLYDLIKEET